jgi:hypothetical protein
VKHGPKHRTTLSAIAALFVISAAPAANADEAKKEEEKIQISGLVDWYYMYSFNHPGQRANLTGRAFDIVNDSASLAVGQVNIVKPASAGAAGFTANLTIGKTADLFHMTEPGGMNTYKYLQQLYGTYITKGRTPFTIDAGKFVTHVGYELTESTSNDNYSRGLLYTFGPYYHTGIRVSAPISSTLSGMVGISNGWNNVEEDNGGKTIIAQLAYKPNDRVQLYLNYTGGDEGSLTVNPQGGLFGGIGFPGAGIYNVQFIDLNGVWQVSPKLKFAAQVDYASARGKGVPGGVWNGFGLWARYQLSEKQAVAMRAERLEDTSGLRTGAARNVYSFTATYEYLLKSNIVTKVEWRHDKAGVPGSPFFLGAGGRDQDTFTFSQVFRF